ncbi:RHS repeat domain-containing protein [Bdellovibrio svalbardensis]|uniref:Teneurin-like YD-shell domain-containing protein n=1 Tax=Bdellovibrio svalbardensis TaxID=2972972 RepID=A0ABT6DHV4_9BACT|nr:RHS repeat-associated core domain-containing protein [Bdellovibrio svalbardensis]MDG0816435.1 hypothetical protein [Bdellovibrio svalbardensis]
MVQLSFSAGAAAGSTVVPTWRACNKQEIFTFGIDSSAALRLLGIKEKINYSLLQIRVFVMDLKFGRLLVLIGVSLTASFSYADFTAIGVLDEARAQQAKSEQCSDPANVCRTIPKLVQTGSSASCVVAGVDNIKETSSDFPGQQSFMFEYSNSCSSSVEAKIRFGGSWSPSVILPKGQHVWIGIEFDSYADMPIEVSLSGSGAQTPSPQPNPTPAPTPNKPGSIPVTSDRPGQCKPGVGSSNIPGHSVINLERQSVSESIPVVGASFYLNYSSDRFKKGSNFNSKFGSIGGWSLSIQHYLDVKNKVIYFGDGRIRKLFGDELYYFEKENLYAVDNLRFYPDGRIAKIWQLKPDRMVWFFQYERDYLAKVTTDTKQVYTFSKFGIVTPFGQKTTFEFDQKGSLSKVTNPNNESYLLASDSIGRLVSFQKPSGLKTLVTYDEEGNLQKDQGPINTLVLSSHIDAEKNAIYIAASSSSNKLLGGVRIENNEQLSTVVHKNDFGSFSSSFYSGVSSDSTVSGYVDIYNGTYTSKYEHLRQKAFSDRTKVQFEVKGTNFKSTSETYIKEEFDKRFTKTTLTYLQNNDKQPYKLVEEESPTTVTLTSPLLRTMKTNGSSMEKNLTIQIGDLLPTGFSYDSLARVTAIKQGDRQQTFAYDSFGNLASVLDPLGRKTSFEYDKANRPVKQILAGGNAIEFAYDLDGNLKSIKPPGKPNHSFVTGLTGLVEGYLPPSIQSKVTGSTVYSYDQDKKLTKISRPDGKNVEFVYAADSFLVNAVTTPDGNYQIKYAPIKDGKSDLPGELTAPDGTKMSFNYVWMLPTSINTTGDVNSTVGYSYNTDLSLGTISVAGADGKAVVSNAVAYDLDGLLTGVGGLAMTRNNVGAVSATTLGKIVEGIGFNTYGEQISSGFTIDKKPIFGMSYNRDKVGRIAASQDVTGTTKIVSTYEYDAQGRLSKVTKGSDARTYTYDANGNRLSFTSGSKSYTGIYDEQDRLLSYGDSKFEYNDNGDLQTRTDVNPETKETKMTSYTYDVFGNLRKVVLPDGRLIEYVIDGQNRRIGKKINGKVVQAFIYQSQYQIAAEMDGSGKIVKSFVYASKVNVPDYVNYNGKQFRVISDQVGTPKMIVDSANGQVVESFNYDEFGVSLDGKTSAIIPFGFAGGLYDGDTGLVRFGVRDYSPVVGRWTNKDPIGFNGGQGNLYVYSENDPVNLIDPSGKFWTVAIGAVIGGISGYYTTGGSASGIAIGVISGALSGTGIGSGSLASAGISAVANIATQVAGGTSIWDINKESVLMSAASGFAGALIGNTVNLALPGSKFTEKILAPAIGGAFGAGADAALTNDFALGKTCP